MSTQEQLIAALKEKFPNESQAGLARKAGLSVQRFNNYCTGIRTMDVDAVIGCAQAVGWDIRATVAQHEIEVAPTPRVKAMWQKLAGASLIALCAIGLSGFPAESKAYGFEPQRECILCNSQDPERPLVSVIPKLCRLLLNHDMRFNRVVARQLRLSRSET